MKKFLVVQTVEVEDVMAVLEVTELKFKVILISADFSIDKLIGCFKIALKFI